VDDRRLTQWVVLPLTAVFVLVILFDCVDDVWLGNLYGGVPTALSGIIAAIVAGLLGHQWTRRNGKS